jgi:hypothetical protein
MDPDHQKQNRSHKHSIYMTPQVWEKAAHTAASLNMSTSQLLSQLVIETADFIRPNSMLGLRRNEASAGPSHQNAA